MAIEERRGCGLRKIGKLYLVGGLRLASCDRLPLELKVCPACGQGPRVTRALWKINPFDLWGPHHDSFGDPMVSCFDANTCAVCYPPQGVVAFMLGVGEKFYTPEEFCNEAREMGVSKAIPFIPKGMGLGKTVVYMTHNKGIEVHSKDFKVEHRPAVICAFTPHRVEQLLKESGLTDEVRRALEKRGITPVPVPDDDDDHDRKRKDF